MLSEKLGDTEMQLEREKDTSSMYHRRFRATDLELRDKQKEMVVHSFRLKTFNERRKSS